MSIPKILLVGDYENREFRDAVDYIHDMADLKKCDSIGSALVQLANENWSPAAIVVAQERPGKSSASEIEQLHAAAPLARLVALLGSWCEGETRTGQPWPGVTRVYWHRAIPQLEDLLQAISHGSNSAWNMPRTATEAERLLHNAAKPISPRDGFIVISTETPTAFEALAEACRVKGYSAVWQASHQSLKVEGAAAVLCDLNRLNDNQLEKVKALVAEIKPVPVVALLGFPRWEDRQRLIQAGVASVISKPFLLDDIYRHLDRVTIQQQIRTDMPAAA